MSNVQMIALLRRLAGVVVLSLLILGPGCGSKPETPPAEATSSSNAEPVHGGTAVLGSTADVDSWNEYTSRQDFAAKLHRRTHLRLAQELGDARDTPQSFEPLLAESWESSADGLEIRFHLRESLWSDGRPIGADDVVFTWKAQIDPDVAWIGAGAKDRIERVQAVDPRTVAFHFSQRYPHQLADAVEGGILPQHVYGAIPFADWRTHDWSTVSVGSGPFVLERYRPAQEIALVRNPHYFREGLPMLDRVVIRIVPDASNLLTQIMAGEIDFYEGIAPREAQRFQDHRDIELVSFDYPKYDYIGWNGSRAPFNDPALRRALTLAIDRQSLVDDLLYGYGRVSKGPVLSYSWGSDQDLQAWPYNQQEARRLLQQLGYAVRGEDGTMQGTGAQLEFELMTNSGNRLRESMMIKIQSQLERVGVKVEVRSLAMREMIGKAMSGEYDAYLGGWTFLGKLDLKPIFGSSSHPPQGSNVVFYNNPELDRMLDLLEQAQDWQSMKPTLDAVQRLIHDEQPYTFLYETKRLAVHRERLAGLTIDIPPDPLARLDQAWVQPS